MDEIECFRLGALSRPRLPGQVGDPERQTRLAFPVHLADELNRPLRTGNNRHRYTGGVVFKWDPNKATENLKKHGIDFYEAPPVLGDSLSTTFPDIDHSRAEYRFLTIGMSNRNRTLVVSHTSEVDVVRIISARRATRRERKFYEED